MVQKTPPKAGLLSLEGELYFFNLPALRSFLLSFGSLTPVVSFTFFFGIEIKIHIIFPVYRQKSRKARLDVEKQYSTLLIMSLYLHEE